VRLMNVDTRVLARFYNQLICSFILAADVVGVASESLWMSQTDQHSWKGSGWDWVWMGTGRSEYMTM
jgi:hypothetical protein